MLDPFGILFSDVFRHTDADQKVPHDLVAGLAGIGKRLSSLGQENRAVWLGFNQLFACRRRIMAFTVGLVTPKRAARSTACLAIFSDQIRDHFDVIFGNLD